MYHFSTDLKLLPLPDSKFQCRSMWELFLVHWSICLLLSLIKCFAKWRDKSHSLCCFCKNYLGHSCIFGLPHEFLNSPSSFRNNFASILIGITLSFGYLWRKLTPFSYLNLFPSAHCSVSQFWSSLMSFREVLFIYFNWRLSLVKILCISW